MKYYLTMNGEHKEAFDIQEEESVTMPCDCGCAESEYRDASRKDLIKGLIIAALIGLVGYLSIQLTTERFEDFKVNEVIYAR